MPSGAITAQGTKFLIGDDVLGSTSVTYTEVADIEDITGPSETNTFIDITNHGSSAVERIASLNDSGGLDLTISFQPDIASHGAGSSGLRGLLRNQDKRAMRVKWPTTGSNVDEFNGILSDFNPRAPTADALRADVSVQITGAISSTSS